MVLTSLSSMSSILPTMSISSSSSSLSSAILPLLVFLALDFRVAEGSVSLNAENPTVPPGFSGARLEKSICADRRLVVDGAVFACLEGSKIPIFCNWPSFCQQRKVSYSEISALTLASIEECEYSIWLVRAVNASHCLCADRLRIQRFWLCKTCSMVDICFSICILAATF